MSDIRCKVCGQGFLVYWARTTRSERDAMRSQVAAALEGHHRNAAIGGMPTHHAHPRGGFDVPHWADVMEYPSAASLGDAIPA